MIVVSFRLFTTSEKACGRLAKPMQRVLVVKLLLQMSGSRLILSVLLDCIPRLTQNILFNLAPFQSRLGFFAWLPLSGSRNVAFDALRPTQFPIRAWRLNNLPVKAET